MGYTPQKEHVPSHHLVVVVGTNPQVVTETLWALESLLQLPHGFRSLDIVTTATGNEACTQMLLGPEGALHRYLTVAAPLFRSGSRDLLVNCHVARSTDGSHVRQITNAKDAEDMGDEIFRIVRGLCNKTDSEVHASIAGGYKTMSFYLGLAMCIYARPQDRLYHTLVPQEYLNRSDWFFPQPDEPSPIQCPSLPFPRLRGFLERQSIDNETLYPSLQCIVEAANQKLGPTLPRQFTLLYSARRETVVIAEDPECKISIPNHLADILRICATLPAEYAPRRQFRATLEAQLREYKMEFTIWRTYLSMLNRILEQSFGSRARIQGDGRGRYRIPPGMTIRIEE